MEQLLNLGDRRQSGFCCHCGKGTETRDHVPSKVFLDKPYPANLSVAFACQSCNESFSLDEEYLACLIECVVCGTIDYNAIERKRISSILQRKPALVSKFKQAQKEVDNGVLFSAELPRVKNVLLKLARGHAVYELNEPQLGDPVRFTCTPFIAMDSEKRDSFEDVPRPVVFPEVGSRASQRLIVNEPGSVLWITVQPERYRYLAFTGSGVTIRIVIREYLACEIGWE
ncbi:MAG: hypothetical protein WCV56_00945 [Candidatus Omnitrophota bacterium]